MRTMLVVGTITLVACSSSSPTGTGSDAGPGSTALAKQRGRIVAYVPCDTTAKPVEGATVTIGTRSVTTAKDGTYAIDVEMGKPFSMRVTKTTDPSYVQLIEGDNTVNADLDRGDTRFVSTGTASLLSSALPSYDTTRTVLTIELVKTGSCADLSGATVKVEPTAADALTQYPAACITPVGENAFVTDGVFPAAVVYNLPPASHTITATSPTCTQIPFPYTDPSNGLTYDGTVTTETGTGASFIKVFMR